MTEISIKNPETGEVRIYEDPYYKPGDGDSIYLWTDGNYSCDCNRALFFARAKGEAAPTRPCGDTYIVTAPAEIADDIGGDE